MHLDEGPRFTCSGLAVVHPDIVADHSPGRFALATLLSDAARQGAELAVLPEYFCLLGRGDSDKLAIRESPGRF